MADALANFATSTVQTAPSPATTGTSLTVSAGDGARFPQVPFNASVWPPGVEPTPANAEIVRVTVVATDAFTIVRGAEGSTARSIAVGWTIRGTITAQFLGLGLVNRKPSYDFKIPAFHSVCVSDEFEMSATVEVESDADGIMEVV